jgi:glycerol-3-phosphate dehydrogenase (NAD(P)+)
VVAVGLAIIKILSENNVKIKWWLRRKSDVDFIKKYNHNPSYLTDAPLNPRKVRAYHKMHDALNGVEYVILAVPAAFIPDALKNLNRNHFAGKKIVSAIKGMIPEENMLVTDWMEKVFGVLKYACCDCRSLSRRRGSPRKTILFDNCIS